MDLTTNKQQSHIWKAAGFLLCGFSVGLGAFAAHALENTLSPRYLQVFETGVRYQFYHGLALLLLAFVAPQLKWVLRLLFFGTLIFSVSLYFLSMNEIWGSQLKILGAITPFGGTLMLAGWTLGAYYFLRNKTK